MGQGERISNIFETYSSESPVATELRRLYHNIMNRGDERLNKSFLITSSERGEGKSTIASHLAFTIAQFPKNKVLLVDADLRRPKLHRMLGIENEMGLMDCLRGRRDALEVIRDTRMPNLKAVTSGGTYRAPAQLFETEALDEFFSKVKFYYDYVIVDGAPVLAVSDILFLCNKVDSVLFVILVGETPREVVMRARNILIDSKANIGGVIVNNASEVLPYYYDYKYYGYHQEKEE